jgi:hypothetical protein
METEVGQSKMRKVTSRLLRQRGACEPQIDLFIALGGDRLELTEALCLEHAMQFNWTWAAHLLLTNEAHPRYLAAIRGARERYSQRVNRWWAFWDTYENAQRDLARARASAFFNAWVSPENQIEEASA